MVRIKKSTRKLPRRGRRSGKGGNIIIQQPLQISENILETISIIATLMSTSRKNDGK
jgi:hypothetical protein